MNQRYATGAIVGIETLFQDQLNNPIITADGKITARRLSDDQYAQDAAGASFAAAPLLLPMTRVGDTDSPGWWKFDFDTSLLAADSYVFTITDANSNAKNVPQTAKAIVGDGLVQAIEAAAASGVGRVVYNDTTSQISLYKFDDPTTVLFTFNCKDKNGAPAVFEAIFEKVQT